MQVQKDVNLAPILWYRLGGTAKYLLTCENTEDVVEALEFIQKNNINDTLTLGLGSNLIFTKDYFSGAVIRIVNSDKNFEKINEDMVASYAGANLGDLIEFAFSQNLKGLEWAGGLPGTVGAGVRGNVGAFGGEIKDVLYSAKVIEKKSEGIKINELQNEDLNFSYRSSEVKEQNMIVVSAVFRLKKATPKELEEAKRVHRLNIQYREERHPLEYPNCGSVFKNIKKTYEVEKVLKVYPDIRKKVENDWYGKVSMGYLINRLGYAGYTVGNVKVSEKHNNFIINLGGAKASDVKKIITEIQNDFEKTFRFKPEVEVEIV